ncbi:signal peptidase I [Halococcus sp. IIIV-5B]|uniref:signal peptidase I n=1 Tax=Halococcus sp. IIIV-5B TaxID=2321230 RepID=UPI000E72DEDA|nr:signal peptidase I [Halococcus sp. IIIV-5B]RJT07083.1 signal peptidase I [Halococcus sp. IIIV-5B]
MTVAKVLGTVLLVAAVAPFAVFIAPQALGAENSYVVGSSSMSPEIQAGDIVIVNSVSPSAVSEGDVITFYQGESAEIRGGTSEELITHRVVEKSGTGADTEFVTKGDANEERDPGTVPASKLVGEVMLTIPLVGHVIVFASTRLGAALLVGLPLGALILGELYDLGIAARNSYRERQRTSSDASGDD